MEKHVATFAAGCFWGVEEAFRHLDGVIKTTVGYTGGHTEHPTYEEVCSDRTGHAEAVQVDYDPDQIDLPSLYRTHFFSILRSTFKRNRGLVVNS
ncbi:peptide-methionine (S)-S-oxide reductase [Candidiatus Paracoxiella cheracis]|uniref:peptide-methionine (S)-S-oxide reductase n=1 Tax=Candidiatus Paracoxiella cheracis TaxID=3405120 RepID=UPI003BF567E2